MKPNDSLPRNGSGASALLILGLLMVAIGALVLCGNLNVLPYVDWRHYWPVVLIVGGVLELARFHRARS